MIRELANGIYSFFANAFGSLFSYLGSLFSRFFTGLTEFLTAFFNPVMQLIAAIFYFLYKVGLLLLLIIEIIFRFVFFFVYVMKGLFMTIIGLSYNGQAATLPPRYQEVIDNVQPALQIMQMDKIATLCLWAVWVFIAMALIRVVGARI